MSRDKGVGDGSPPLKPLSQQRLIELTFAVSEGKSDEEDVRQALGMFYRLAVENSPIPRQLIDFVAASFGRCLELKYFHGPEERGASSLDSAFGLLGKKGRPRADEQLRIKMAAEVVRLRLAGTPHQEALDDAAETFGCEKTIIGQAFRDHRLTAVLVNRCERPAPLTPDEKRQLAKILKGQPDI
jgi:hypothetical protein